MSSDQDVVDRAAASDAAFRRGLEFLSEVVPDLDEKMDRAIPANPDLQRLVVEFIYGSLHPRPQLDSREREIVALSVITALGGDLAMRAHVELGYRCGLDRDQILEIILHAAAYAGFPRALSASAVALEVLDELEAGD